MDKEVEDMYELSTKTLELPLEEKINSEGYETLSYAWLFTINLSLSGISETAVGLLTKLAPLTI